MYRGFGFVTFVDQPGVDKVLAQTRHELDSKTVSLNKGFIVLFSLAASFLLFIKKMWH